MDAAIRTEAVTRVYRKAKRRFRKADPTKPAEFVALAGIDLEVRPGELFGLLGPNGAGKTTLIKILTTLLAPSTGRAFVGGMDVVTQAEAIRPHINMVSGGESSGYGILTVRENLWLFARIYGVANKVVKERIDHMLDVVGLADKADSRVTHLSTGQRQKMNFCRGFITDPRTLFLDEPTLGLDVNAARAIRAYLKQWMAERPDRTLLLTTHYMAEADELCDRLAIIDKGKVLACDSPAALKKRVQEYPLFHLTLAPGGDGLAAVRAVPGVHSVTRTETPEAVELQVSMREDAVIGGVVQAVTAHGKLLTLRKVEPTLEDVFIELVGHGIADADKGERPA